MGEQLFNAQEYEKPNYNESRHIVEAEQFSPEFLSEVFNRAQHYKETVRKGGRIDEILFGRILLNVFYEPSTRTRFSFDMAAQRLGMGVADTESASHFSSAAKGETLEDTIKVFSHYRPDVIVLRHPDDDAAERAAAVSEVPIINAGSGKGEHPTQALLDMFTIGEKLGALSGLNVIIGGDLKHGRTAKSLAQLLSKYKGNQIVFLAPESMQITDDVTSRLDRADTPYIKTDKLHDYISDADVVYWTRTQKERGGEVADEFVITADEVTKMKDNAVLMHPLPRIDEIAAEVDLDPRAIYFEQAANGQYVRMALLEWAVNGRIRTFPHKWDKFSTNPSHQLYLD